MDRFLARENIKRFKEQLNSCADEGKRATLKQLITAEQQKLDGPTDTPLELPSAMNVNVLALIADAVICTDEGGRILVFNQAAEQSFGYRAQEVIGQPVELLLPQGDRSRNVEQLRSFASGGGPANRLMGHRREVRGRRKNGDEFPAEAMVSRQTIDGRTILTVVNRDITERKAMEELRETLSNELAHRMKNMLSVVNSLISLSAASASSVELFKESLTGRMRALALSQTVLGFGQQQTTTLSRLLRAELAQYNAPGRRNVVVKAPPVPLGTRAAQLLALAVHELATNSAKYGALASPAGRVSVIAAVEGDGDSSKLMIKWREAGGPPVKPPERQGFGTTLIKDVLGRSLKADVDLQFRPQGLVCQIAVPNALLKEDAQQGRG